MDKIRINIPEGIFHLGEFPDLSNQLPQTSYIFSKKMTGCGATTFFLEDNFPTVLCSPRNELIRCKATSKRHYGKVHAFGFPDNCDDVLKKINSMKEYIRNHQGNPFLPTLPSKILVTYDSCKHVIQGLTEMGLLQQFRFVIDEFQTLWTDAPFRGDIEAEFMENLKYVGQIVYLSATPYLEKYLKQLDEFKNLPIVEINWPLSSLHYTSINHVPYYRKSPQQTIANIINFYRNKGYFEECILPNGTSLLATQALFFVNEVKFIAETIIKNELSPKEVTVICGENDKNANTLKKAGVSIGHAPEEGQIHTPFTFISKTAYEGTDMYHPHGYTYIFSDISKEHLAIDISLNLPQILGRLRISPFRYQATMFYKTRPEFSEEERLEFEEKIKNKAKETNEAVADYESIQDRSKRNRMARKYKTSQKVEKYANDYISVIDDKVTNEPKMIFNQYVFINELRSFEVQKSQYIDGAYVMGAIDDAVNHNIFPEIKSFKQLFSGTFENKMKLLAEFLDLHPECREELLYDASIPRDLKQYYIQLGTSKLRALSWKESAIRNEIANNNSTMDIKNNVLCWFKIGDRYRSKDVKDTLQKIYDQLGLNKTAKATDLQEWFLCKEIKISNNGTREHGYEILGLK